MNRFRIVLPLLLLAGVIPAGAAGEPRFTIIVNAANPLSALSKEEASEIFLKKVGKWPDGSEIVPIDQAEDSEVRREFCWYVHGRKAAAIRNYWEQAYFSGKRTPPPWMSSDDSVEQFVAANPRAIGYVTAAAELPDRVKPVRLEN
jgi:ABC-type phosphate transport system substrate-binding protein